MARWYISTLKTNMAKKWKPSKIDDTRNYLLVEIRHKDLMSEKHEKVWRTLNELLRAFSCFCFCGQLIFM